MMEDAAPDATPPDRAGLNTEQRLPASGDVDCMTTSQILQLINAQDATVPNVVGAAIPAITKLTDAIINALEQGGRLIYVGAGTSGRLGVMDAAECPPTFHSDPEDILGIIAGGSKALTTAVEGAEDEPEAGATALHEHEVNDTDVVLGIAAGGTTPYVWGALNAARAAGTTTALLTCVCRSELDTQMLDHLIELPVGAEVVTGSTRLKAGTATKLTLNMITTAAFVRRGKVWGNLMVDLTATNDKLRDRAVRIICGQAGVSRDKARQLLERANGRVKFALVMAKLNVSLDQARRHLNETSGHLRPLLGPPREDCEP